MISGTYEKQAFFTKLFKNYAFELQKSRKIFNFPARAGGTKKTQGLQQK